MMVLALALAGAMACAGSAKDASSADKRVDERLETGSQLATNGDYDAAITQFRLFLEEHPDNAYAHYLLGVALLEQGKDEEAVTSLEEAVKRDPGLTDAYLALGNASMKRADLDKAFQAFSAATRADPNNPSAWYDLGVTYFTNGDFKQAAIPLAKAHSLRPDDPQISFRLGMAHFRSGATAEAALALEDAVTLDPNNELAWINLANSRTLLGNFDASREAIARVLVLRPGWSVALNSQGVLAQTEGRDTDALHRFEEALAADATNLRVHLNLAGLYEKLGRTDEAIGEYEKYLAALKDSRGTGETIRKRIEALKAR